MTADIISLWERWFPGKGQAIVDLLRPVCTSDFTFKPQLPPPDLALKVRKAIFWRETRAVTWTDNPKIVGERVITSLCGTALADRDRIPSGWPGVSGPQVNGWKFIIEGLHDTVNDLELCRKLDKEIGDLLQVEPWPAAFIAESFWESLKCDIAWLIENDEGDRGDRPTLLSIWLAGNLIAGVDQQYQVIILCASPRTQPVLVSI